MKDLATVVPIVHVLTACFYLFGYSQGFDHHVIAFLAVGDVFVASLRAVGQVYLFLALPLLAFMIQRSLRRKMAGGLILYSLLAVAAALTVALILATQTAPIGRGLPANVSLILIPVVLIGLLAGLIHADGRGALANALSPANIAILCVMLFMFALLFGFNKGATDRVRQFTQSEDRFFSCFDGRQRRFVIRSMGSHYLALGEDDGWALVDDTCAIRFFLGDVPARLGREGNGSGDTDRAGSSNSAVARGAPRPSP